MNLSGNDLTLLNDAILSLYTPFGLSELPDSFLAATRPAVAGNLTHISLTNPAAGTVDAISPRMQRWPPWRTTVTISWQCRGSAMAVSIWGRNKSSSKSMGWKAPAPPVPDRLRLGWTAVT